MTTVEPVREHLANAIQVIQAATTLALDGTDDRAGRPDAIATVHDLLRTLQAVRLRLEAAIELVNEVAAGPLPVVARHKLVGGTP